MRYVCHVPALSMCIHLDGDSEEGVKEALLHDLNRRFGCQRYAELPKGTEVRAAVGAEATALEDAQRIVSNPYPPMKTG